jgi:hypothetical protein
MDTKKLLKCADAINASKGWGLCGSKWQNTEAETIACQMISSCGFNLRNSGEAITFMARSLHNGRTMSGINALGLLQDEFDVVEYTGKITPKDPSKIATSNGKYLILIPKDSLLNYVMTFMKL